ncbi:TonB-dependent receptor [Cytophagaceae bacterium DM2B3-1]|uniref:TonB-dependent receptor n=1 Tax=Xanthocytophaga flava TaxID=3048013 RepID=A0ABT7CNT7_9BACT|nr:TonB-dependent receptor [Xanthocytophaga flavus]MDJ1495392.1 TonB-dependent receptor [Xanthocytophaga flavus]
MSTIGTSQKSGNLPDDGHRSISFRSSPLKFLWLLFLLLSTTAYAQKTVSGKVTDAADGSGLPGVSVSVKGTTTGTTTDASGSYSLSIPGDNTTLVFSFVGYITQEIAVGNRSSVTVSLAADVQSLQEVVVIGYGEQRKQDVTGGLVALTPKDYNKGVIASPEQLLQGRAAGVQITPASGEPGAAVNIRIRGTTSIRGGNNPLYVVDGVPLDGGNTADGNNDYGQGSQSARNPLTFLNPADIESITVLKDASAAAIYGARGANGVVIITTRKGKAGQPSLNFSATGSTSTPLKRYDLLNASEFLAGLSAAGGDAEDPTINRGNNTNWQDQIFRTAISQNYSLDFSGGSDNTSYFFSLGYSDQQGIIKNSGLNRLSARVNATHRLFNDKVILALNLTTSGVKDKYPPNGDNAGAQGNLIGAALQTNPTYPVKNADGSYFTPGGDFRNAAAMVNLIDDNGNTNRTLANFSATWKILKGLTYKLNLGLDNSTAVRRTAIPLGVPGFTGTVSAGGNNTGLNVANGFASIQNRFRNNLLLEHTLTYTGKVGIGTLEALGGFAYQRFENRGNFLLAANFLPDVLKSGIPLYDVMGGVNNSGTNKSYYGGGDRMRNELQSVFGRLNYNINDKYIITATLRVDGSSRFGPNHKYGYFPSLAGAWRISQEKFMSEGIFSDLKLRLNWGLTGNQEYPGNTSRVIYNFDPNNGNPNAQNNPNPNIKWEQTQQYGAGLDFGFMDGRLNGTFDYFKKGTKDLIFQYTLGQPAATTFVWVNLPGNLNNEGFELALNYDVLRDSKLKWQVSYNMTHVTTKVTGIGTIINTGAISGQGLSGAYSQQIRDGYPIGAFFLRQFAGYTTQNDTSSAGLGIYPNKEQLSYAGNAIPKFNFGLNNSFTYGKLDLSIFFTASTGFYIYNNTANAYFIKGNLRNGRNVTKDAANSPESADNFAEASTRFLEKGNFLRLSNLSVGYNFTLPSGGYAKSLRVYATGQNLLLFTKYSGIDPEVNTNKAIDGVPSIGIDYTSYPSARTFTVGLNVGF